MAQGFFNQGPTVNDCMKYIRGLNSAMKQQAQQIGILQQVVTDLQSRPRSVQEEIDAIEGRRIEGTLTGEVTFDVTDLGQRGAPILFQVSQDGPFVMTHYPLVLWRPSAPDNTTNLNRWRPVSSFPLPTQQVTTDIIDIMYEMADGGSQRMFQNEPRAPLFSRPDNIVPCPVPTLWSPAAAIQFIPTYLALTWNSATPPTEGVLHVDLIGYRIVNM
jgi:hypothetical protein